MVRDLPLPENKKFYPALDGLRAVAVLLVFCQHYINEPMSLHWGWTGVDIFFVLSGFLITGILYDTRNNENRLRTFYIRRSLRIFPLYYGLFFIAFITTPIFHWVWNDAWYLWLVYLGNYAQIDLFNFLLKGHYVFDVLRSTRIHNPGFTFIFGHFWSLCIEEQFYLIWPFVVYSVKERVRLRNLCAGLVVAIAVVRSLAVFALPHFLLHDDFFYRFTPLRVDALILGAFVALCLRGSEAKRIVELARPVMIGILVIFAALTLGSLLLTHHPIAPNTTTPLISTVGFTLVDILAASVILHSLDPRSLTYRILNLRWLRRLGQLSYGFYVYHQLFHFSYRQLVFAVLGEHMPHVNLPIAFVGFIGTVIISYLSFRFFEAPFLRLKDRLAA